MPRKGQMQPWKIVYQYPGQQPGTIPKAALPDAARELVTMRGRGATAALSYRDAEGLREFSDKQIVAGLREQYGDLYDHLIRDIEQKSWEQGDEEQD